MLIAIHSAKRLDNILPLKKHYSASLERLQNVLSDRGAKLKYILVV